MGSTAAGHIAGFLLLFPTALRRVSSSVSLHLRCPPGCFRPRPWYFSDHHHHDLHALLLLLPLAALSDLLLLPPPDSARHAASLLLFWLLLLLPVYLRHRLDPSSLSLPDDLVFLLAAFAFLADRALSSAPPSSSSAVEARAYQLMGWPTLACTAACMAMAAGRASLATDAALCMGLALKATWALQSALTIFAVPPEGCKLGGVGSGGALECELEEDRARAVALLDLLFVLHAAGIAAGYLAVYWALAWSAQRAPEFESAMTRPMIVAQFELD